MNQFFSAPPVTRKCSPRFMTAIQPDFVPQNHVKLRDSCPHQLKLATAHLQRSEARTAMKFGVIIFPGSNCDHDAYWTIQHVARQTATLLWHESHDLENCDVIIVPGGFAYGDYLRTGAIAKFAPIMREVAKFAGS